ncbi:MAG TPA: PP2C family protein-serine/threonine phosphatase [Planctomycetota bacterium]|nr:PP2C family protein-serine/threonine phosphatase [Planctomycetota bacterium]
MVPSRRPETRSSPIDLVRRRTMQRLNLRGRMGLLSGKAQADPLDPVEKKMLQHELAIAEELQSNLLPRRIPKIGGVDLSAYYRPSEEVGGDYYDFIEIDDDHLGIAVADVSGKGIPGAMVMTEARALLKSEAGRSLSPAETLLRVNRVLFQDIKRGMFVTMSYMVLSIKGRSLTLSSAGHLPLILWRRASGTCHGVNPLGLALGIDKGPLFEKKLREERVALEPGDRFVGCTDGVLEAMNSEHEELGTERLHALVAEHAERPSGEFVTKIIDGVEAHQGAAPQHDDITLVTGRIAG